LSLIAGSGAAGAFDGIGSAANFTNPFGVVADLVGNVFVTDPTLKSIRRVDANKSVSLLRNFGPVSGWPMATAITNISGQDLILTVGFDANAVWGTYTSSGINVRVCGQLADGWLWALGVRDGQRFLSPPSRYRAPQRGPSVRLLLHRHD